MANGKMGLWLVGARGRVGAAVAVGLAALQRDLLEDTSGLVSTLPQFVDLDLPDWNDWVLGGHDVRDLAIIDQAQQLVAAGVLHNPEWIATCRRPLLRMDKCVRDGVLAGATKSVQDMATVKIRRLREDYPTAIARVQEDLAEFVRKQKLDGLVVVNLATAEDEQSESDLPRKWADLERLMSQPRKCRLPCSSVYAIATLQSGYPFINLSESAGAKPAAISQLAQERHVCHMGNGPKSMERFLKGSLVPSFVARNLIVTNSIRHRIHNFVPDLSADQSTSAAYAQRTSELIDVTKHDAMLQGVLGYEPSTIGSRTYVAGPTESDSGWESLHLRGFLNTPLTIQMNWKSIATAWTAASVLDVARFTACAQRLGITGSLEFLASFFEQPMGVKTRDHCQHTQSLFDWARTISAARA
ncbi:MAG: inositol-3-phosphate synthase [Planctomycetales bacterium]|nr:inositol-3-phosphate synthase [Planctomycetales bacterium]